MIMLVINQFFKNIISNTANESFKTFSSKPNCEVLQEIIFLGKDIGRDIGNLDF